MRFIDISELEQGQLGVALTSLIYPITDAKNVRFTTSEPVEKIMRILEIKHDELECFVRGRVSSYGASQTLDDVCDELELFINSLLATVTKQRSIVTKQRSILELEELHKEFVFLNIKARFDIEFIHPVDYLNMGYLTLAELKKYGVCYVCQRLHMNKKTKGTCIISKKELYLEKTIVLDCHQFKGQSINIENK
jgi:hypothetical protein